MTGDNEPLRSRIRLALGRSRKPVQIPTTPTDRLRRVADGRASGTLTEGEADRLSERIVQDALSPDDVDVLDRIARE